MAGIAAPAGTDWSGEPLGRTLNRQTPEQMASKMLAEKRSLNERTRLSWDPNKVPIKGDGRFVGQVCLSLPYVIVDKKYYVQNCRLFKSNGEEVTLEQIFELENGGSLYLRIKEVLDNHLKDALAHDPQLCKYCKKQRFDTTEAFMQHVVDEHPDVIATMAGVKLDAPAAETDIQAPWCQACDRTFKTAGGLRLHRIKVHDKAA